MNIELVMAEVMRDFQMTGFADGIYGDFVREVVKRMTGWMPIETVPKNAFSRLYLIKGFCVQGFIDATGALMVQSEISPHWRIARGKPTHWMPLPEAPNV